jgi:hypothetical protein
MITSVITISPSTSTHTPNDQSTLSFVGPICPNASYIGLSCNISMSSCEVIKQCKNSGTCVNHVGAPYGYKCSCASGFLGDNCDLDNRPCKLITCWNNGR